VNYADSTRQPPKTLTEAEQRAFLRACGEHKDGFRDHVLFSFALGTALREHELAALNVGDVYERSERRVRLRVQLRVYKGQRDGALDPRQEATLPAALRYKLEKFMHWKVSVGEAIDFDSPLFVSRGTGQRIACRTIRYACARWQKLARLDRRFTFHHLRHTALTNLYRATRDIRLVQRVARHAKLETTTIYASPSDEDVARAVHSLPC